MNLKSAAVIIFFVPNLSFADKTGWFYLEVVKSRQQIFECLEANQTITPAARLKHYDEIEMPYEKQMEVRDKTAKVMSLQILKLPKSPNQEMFWYFRDLKSCKNEYSKLKTEIEKSLEPKRQEEKAKYGDYK